MPRGYGHGVAVGDYDNDGHPDLFVTRWRSYALYRNRGDGTFEDVTAQGRAGRRPRLADVGGLRRSRQRRRPRPLCLPLRRLGHRQPPDLQGPVGDNRPDVRPPRRSSRSPTMFSATTPAGSSMSRPRRGSSTATAGAWASSPPTWTAMGGSTSSSPTTARRTSSSATWEDFASRRSAIRRAWRPMPEADIRPAWAWRAAISTATDVVDLAVTNYYGESTTLFHNLGGGLFADHTAAVGLAAPSRYRLGFGAAFLDANNDGWLDLLTANGHVSDSRPLFPYAMTPQLLPGHARQAR